MQPFSRQKQLVDALETKIKRAKILSRGNINTDWDIAHPDYVRDAEAKNFTKMVKDIKAKHDKHVADHKIRQEKKYGKK